MTDDGNNEVPEEPHKRAAGIQPEYFLPAAIIIAGIMAWVGLARNIPSAVITSLVLGILSLVTGDVVWSLDFQRAKAETDDAEDLKTLGSEEKQYERLHRPILLMAGSIAFLILTGLSIIPTPTVSPEGSTWAYGAMVAALVIGVLTWWVGPRIADNVKSIAAAGIQSENLETWFRISAVIIWISVLAYPASTAKDPGSSLIHLFWLYRLAGLTVFILVVELMVRSSLILLSSRSRSLPKAPVPTMAGSVILERCTWYPVSKGRGRIPDTMQSSRLQWLGMYLEKSLPRVIGGLLIILWLATSITQVGVSEQGVRERFGAFTGHVLEPGIHLGWPWPIDSVRTFPSRKLQVMKIGFTTDRPAALTNLIWTESHGITEDRFVTASGSEVISFDIEIFYRIEDVRKYAYTCLNPEVLLKNIAYKAIMLRTNSTNTDTLLGRDRAELAEGLREDIQAESEIEGIGVEVAQVTIVAIHPPFEVADAYQAVVSAQVYRETLGIQASTYAEEIIPSAWADAQVLEDTASAYAVERTATARGEATGFTSLAGAVRNDYGVYRFRRRIEALETGLAGKRLYIVSREFIDSPAGEDPGLWFDLR